MAISKTSTIQDALDQYNDNLLWEGSATKANNCLAAVRFLFMNREKSMNDEGTQINYNDLQKEKEKLEAFVDSIGQGASSASPFVRARPI